MTSPIRVRRFYTTKERLLLRPLLDRLKLPRNEWVSRRYEKRPAEGFDAFLADLGDVRDQSLLFTVAFNLPWAVDLMIRSTRRHMPEWRLVVIDNSNKPERRTEIAAICRAAGVPLLSLPKNPEWSPNRSHALALNWVWRNVIRPLRPRHFGFVDHDCFPVAPSRQLARIRERAFDGLKRVPPRVEGLWFLWAGYMFFNTARIGDRDLDFNHDQALHLDTAGRNWTRLYREIDPDGRDLLEWHMATLPALDHDGTVEVASIDATMVHIGGASYLTGGTVERHTADVRALVERSLEAPITLPAP